MAELLSAVLNYLDITWQDDAIVEKYNGIIANGIFYLDSKAGAEQDYSVSGYARSLLMDYCRYARDNALEVFENNFKAQILAMRHESMVNSYVQSAE